MDVCSSFGICCNKAQCYDTKAKVKNMVSFEDPIDLDRSIGTNSFAVWCARRAFARDLNHLRSWRQDDRHSAMTLRYHKLDHRSSH